MTIGTNNSIDPNLKAYEVQRANRATNITNDVSLTEEQKNKFLQKDPNVSVDINTKKDDAGNTAQSSNQEIKDNINVSRGNKAQDKLLEQIQNKIEASSSDNISNTQRADIQKEIDSMIKTYDTIANITRTNTSQEVLKSNESGETKIEVTQDIATSGTANVTLEDKDGNNIKINSELNSNDIKKSLNDLAQEINKKTQDTGVTASVLFDNENESGKLLLSKAGEEDINYKIEIENNQTTTTIKTQDSATFNLSDLQSKNSDATSEKLESLGINSTNTDENVNSIFTSQAGTSIASNIVKNTSSEINTKQVNIEDTIKTIQNNAKEFLSQLQNSSANNFNFGREVSNGLQGLGELNQAGSLLISQANPNPNSVLRLLA
jgi:hypothetical protein